MTDRPTAGTRIGAYIVRSRVAVGGMAEVYVAAEQRSAGSPREVVIKRLLPQLASDTDARRMFDEEARLGARIHHPNVAKVLGSGMDAGQPYLVLELVRGCDLWRLLRHLGSSRRVLGLDVAIFVACELARGVAAVHEATDVDGSPLGIVHHDISPSNVLLSTYGDVKLSDLGIARTKLRDHFGATPTGDRMKGKLGYFAPEQVHGRGVDQRSDVFSTATVAAELLLGKPLFSGTSELAILLSIRDADVSPIHAVAKNWPIGLADVVLAALARDAEARTPSARALLEGLSKFLPEDLTPLRHELGMLVGQASASTSQYPLSATPTQRTKTRTMPPASSESIDVEFDVDEDRPTLEIDAPQYQLSATAHEPFALLTYAAIVERIATGRIRPGEMVRVDGAEPRRVSSISELSRHLPKSRSSVPAGSVRFAFAGGGFVRAFVRAVLESRTGLFVCERTAERKEISVEGGVPSFAGSNVAGEMLGEFLVSRGVLSRGELDMALAVMPKFHGHLGDTLVGLGLVEPVHLFRHIEVQIRERMLDVFTWTEGGGRFDQDVRASHTTFHPEQDIVSLFDEGIRRRTAAGLDRELVTRGLASRIVRNEAGAEGVDFGRLGKAEKLLLSRIRVPSRGTDIMEDLARDIGGDRPRAARALVLLHHAGMLDILA